MRQPTCESGVVVDGRARSHADAGGVTRHELTCCADESVSGWKTCRGGTVWAERDGTLFQNAKVNLGYTTSTTGTYIGVGSATAAGGAFYWQSSGCVHNAEWQIAAEICNAMVINPITDARARLCSKDELLAQCGRGSGCGHDRDNIWSSTPASNETEPCWAPIGVTSESQSLGSSSGETTSNGANTVVIVGALAGLAVVAAIGLLWSYKRTPLGAKQVAPV